MTKPTRPAAFYNPHLLSRDELVAGFIARQPLLDLLVDDLRRGGGQHHLLIGARGTGKTTLLLRLGVAIDDDSALAKKAIALRFPEEQYNVSRPSDLWLNCVDALVDALERRGEAGEARRLDGELAKLEDLEEDERAQRGLQLLAHWSKRARKLLVLLIDNLDLILGRMPDDHWALRKALGADRQLVLVGASSRHVQESFEYGSAFYEFFNVHELGPLSDEDARRVLLHLAQVAGTPWVPKAIEDDPGRFKALLLLSGGTPRTLGLLHEILANATTTNAEQDLETLLDQVTPYYKARFDDLPDQSQLVVDAVALHWHPMSAAECAAKTRLDVSLASAQLSRLVRQGVIEKVPSAEGKLAFQISERFFNIWYLMRASRRLRRKLLWLVGFLQDFYGQGEIDRRAADLLATVEHAESEPGRMLELASAVTNEAGRRRLELRAVEALGQGLRTDSTTNTRLTGIPEAWRGFVRQGHAREIADLLEAHSWRERVLPLYEALRAAAAGPDASLAHLAPEIRKPAEDVLQRLLAPDPIPAADTLTTPATTPGPALKANKRPKPRTATRTRTRKAKR